jgi:hypothetical protein
MADEAPLVRGPSQDPGPVEISSTLTLTLTLTLALTLALALALTLALTLTLTLALALTLSAGPVFYGRVSKNITTTLAASKSPASEYTTNSLVPIRRRSSTGFAAGGGADVRDGGASLGDSFGMGSSSTD